MGRSARQAVRGLALAAAAYTAAVLVRYFVFDGPRFQVESAFFIFAAIGTIAVLLRGDDRAGPERLRDGFGSPPNLLVLAVAFIAAAFALYAPAMRIGLLSDDFVIARWAERFELVHLEATGFLRPAVPLFWGALQQLPGDFGALAHAGNVILHGVNAALVSLIAARLGVRRFEAVAAGAVFALFPGLSEAIVWASGVQDVLMTTLALTAVLFATEDKPRLVLAVAASVAALLVKETAVAIPVLAALVMVGRDGFRLERRKQAALIALSAVSALYVVTRATAGMPSPLVGIPDWQYFAKQLVANSFATVGAPWTDTWGRAHAGPALVRALSILILAAAATVHWRRHDATFRAAAACLAWVLAGVLPVFSFFYVGPNLEGARYVYLPAAGFSILLALLAGLAADRLAGPARPAAVGLMVGVLAVPFLPAIRSDLGRWEAAAVIRQQVLAQAPDHVARAGCTTFVAEGDADNVSGAYVFREGLKEALALSDADVVVPCRVIMKSGEIIVSRSDR